MKRSLTTSQINILFKAKLENCSFFQHFWCWHCSSNITMCTPIQHTTTILRYQDCYQWLLVASHVRMFPCNRGLFTLVSLLMPVRKFVCTVSLFVSGTTAETQSNLSQLLSDCGTATGGHPWPETIYGATLHKWPLGALHLLTFLTVHRSTGRHSHWNCQSTLWFSLCISTLLSFTSSAGQQRSKF